MEIKGNYVYALIIILSIIPITFGALLLEIVSISGFLLAILFFGLIFYLYYGPKLHYYYLDENSITVKNVLFWWVNKVYQYANINKIKIYGRPDGNDLVIINSDKFISNNLNKKDFEFLSDFLRKKNIPVEFDLNR